MDSLVPFLKDSMVYGQSRKTTIFLVCLHMMSEPLTKLRLLIGNTLQQYRYAKSLRLFDCSPVQNEAYNGQI
jgi:hypothetical protein